MKKIVWALAIMLFATGLHAQITATTGDGRIVILLDDGTWKFDTTAVAKKIPKFKKKRKKGAETPKNPALAAIKCADIAVTKLDPQMGEEMTMLSELIEIKDGGRRTATINLSANKGGTIFWNINIMGQQGCKSRTPQVKVNFTDGSKMVMEVANDFICDNNTTLYIGKKTGKKDELSKLQNRTISTITVVSQDQSEVVTELPSEQANVLQKAFICLTSK